LKAQLSGLLAPMVATGKGAAAVGWAAEREVMIDRARNLPITKQSGSSEHHPGQCPLPAAPILEAELATRPTDSPCRQADEAENARMLKIYLPCNGHYPFN
jgi:hypothetical protein